VLALALVALFVPAALLSAITPLVIKLQLSSLDETGRVVGRLSSVGTLGGITATLLTGFVLVAALPTSVIVLALAGLLVLVSLVLWRYGGRRRLAASAVVAVLAGGGLVAVAPNPCDIETAYHCARITADPARPSGRVLWLNGARHSYVDLVDPKHLEFAYAKWIGAFSTRYRPGRSTCCMSAEAGSPSRRTWPRRDRAPTAWCWRSTGHWSTSTAAGSACAPAPSCGHRRRRAGQPAPRAERVARPGDRRRVRVPRRAGGTWRPASWSPTCAARCGPAERTR
jgi:hypothetical protein